MTEQELRMWSLDMASRTEGGGVVLAQSYYEYITQDKESVSERSSEQ